MVEKAETSYGAPRRRLIYGHRFALLAALFAFLYVVPLVRFVLRLVIASRPAFRFSSCSASRSSSRHCVSSVRFDFRSVLRIALRVAFLLARGRWFPLGAIPTCSPLATHYLPCRSAFPSRLSVPPFVSSLRPAFSGCPFATIPSGTVSPCSPLAVPCRAVPNDLDGPDEMRRETGRSSETTET